MYIVRQNGNSIVNSNHVTLYYIEDKTSAYAYDIRHDEPYRVMTDCIGLLQNVLGYYNSLEAANIALQQLLSALQGGKDIFYMPQP